MSVVRRGEDCVEERDQKAKHNRVEYQYYLLFHRAEIFDLLQFMDINYSRLIVLLCEKEILIDLSASP